LSKALQQLSRGIALQSVLVMMWPVAGDEKPAKKGFLASIGMGGESTYVDEDD